MTYLCLLRPTLPGCCSWHCTAGESPEATVLTAAPQEDLVFIKVAKKYDAGGAFLILLSRMDRTSSMNSALGGGASCSNMQQR